MPPVSNCCFGVEKKLVLSYGGDWFNTDGTQTSNGNGFWRVRCWGISLGLLSHFPWSNMMGKAEYESDILMLLPASIMNLVALNKVLCVGLKTGVWGLTRYPMGICHNHTPLNTTKQTCVCTGEVRSLHTPSPNTFKLSFKKNHSWHLILVKIPVLGQLGSPLFFKECEMSE